MRARGVAEANRGEAAPGNAHIHRVVRAEQDFAEDARAGKQGDPGRSAGKEDRVRARLIRAHRDALLRQRRRHERGREHREGKATDKKATDAKATHAPKARDRETDAENHGRRSPLFAALE